MKTLLLMLTLLMSFNTFAVHSIELENFDKVVICNAIAEEMEIENPTYAKCVYKGSFIVESDWVKEDGSMAFLFDGKIEKGRKTAYCAGLLYPGYTVKYLECTYGDLLKNKYDLFK